MNFYLVPTNHTIGADRLFGWCAPIRLLVLTNSSVGAHRLNNWCCAIYFILMPKT